MSSQRSGRWARHDRGRNSFVSSLPERHNERIANLFLPFERSACGVEGPGDCLDLAFGIDDHIVSSLGFKLGIERTEIGGTEAGSVLDLSV